MILMPHYQHHPDGRLFTRRDAVLDLELVTMVFQHDPTLVALVSSPTNSDKSSRAKGFKHFVRATLRANTLDT